MVGRATSFAREALLRRLRSRFVRQNVYLLYLDESGNHAEASYFVLAGLAVFEREIHWFADDLNSLQTEYLPD